MDYKEQMMKKIIIIFLAIAFCSSVFLIVASKYGLWNQWVNDSNKQTLSIFSEDNQWKHLKEMQEPGVGNVWTNPTYNSDGWEPINGEYHENVDETGNTTAFFRYEFDLEDVNQYEYMEGSIQYADAVLVYLNGNVVFAGNVPEGGYNSNLDMGASNTVETNRESSFVITDLDNLIVGKNVLAVEVHRKDKTSKNINFNFQNLNISTSQYNEEVPDTEGIVLKKGETSDVVEVDWVTNIPESYKIEYMEGTLDTVSSSTFSQYASTVIMGNKEFSTDSVYQKTGQISRLKEQTNYVYRVMRIGGQEGSTIYQFHTPEKQETRLLYTGVTADDLLSNSENGNNWKNRLKKAVDITGGTDCLVAGKLMNNQDELFQNELLFRAPQELKEIPVIVSSFESQMRKGDILERQCIAYMDLLVINLNTNDKDYDGVRNYIKDVMQEKRRKWNMVVVSMPEDIEENKIDENYLSIFKELNIDFVLVNGSAEYFNDFTGKASNDIKDNVYIKEQGETLYTYGGNMALAVNVSTDEVKIQVYDIEKETQEEILLTKPN